MPFITQGKTNIKYIMIIVILAAIVSGGVLAYQYWWLPSQEIKIPEIKPPQKTVCNWRPNINKYGQCEKMLGYYYDGKKCQPLSGCDLKGDKIPFLSMEECKNQCEKGETATCSKNTDCILAYTGENACVPCDFSDSNYQCVSSEQAQKLEQERIKRYGQIMCEPCGLSPILFRCICKENICLKTVLCDKDEDCNSEAFEDLYKCRDSNCVFLPEGEGFCGLSTNGSCSVDSDCITGGCSGQVCQSKSEEPVGTTCEWKDCYDETQYGLNCKCVSNKCQWSK